MSEFLKNVTATPMADNGLTADQKKEKIAEHMKGILETLGLDLTDDSLKDTPRRVAKMYVDEVFSGLDDSNFPKISVFENKMATKQMIAVKGISVVSCCEHHLATIHGIAHVAYIPGEKIIGLSKLSRIVSHFSRRPQVQERLTVQIADCLQNALGTKDVAVYIDAKHYCMIARGVQESDTTTVTTELRGKFLEQEQTRSEFLSLCKK